MEQHAEALRNQGYPDEMISTFIGMAQAAQSAEIGSLNKKVSDMSGNLESVQRESAEQGQRSAANADAQFQEAMTANLSNWREINDNPEFVSWTQEIDEGAGVSKLQLLQDAYAKHDLNRTLYFFKQWDAINRSAQDNFGPGSQITPPEGGGDALPAGNGKRYSKAEVSEFYSAAAAGRYRGREEEYQRIDPDITAAQSEGRIY